LLSSFRTTTATAAAATGSSMPRMYPIPATPLLEGQPVHLVVLVHGWLGNPSELGYLEQAIQRKATQLKDNNIDSNNNNSVATEQEQEAPPPLFLVHSSTANNGRTSDGIAAGGSRLASEINDWVKALTAKIATSSSSSSPWNSNNTISLSFIGNSLGGLYARYALSEIHWNLVQPAVFCTTVTPHLGVAAPHTYLNLPRIAEYGVASTMRQTGLDLFRVSNVIEQMTVDPQFMLPLSKFRRRMALANAHNTDFQVPCSTAAFLSKTDSLHRVVASSSSSLFPNAVLRVETEKQEDAAAVCFGDSSSSSSSNSNIDDEDNDQQLSSDEIAVRLDALGWTKVFCDVRDHLPSLNPLGVGVNTDDDNTDDKIESKDVYTATELWNAYATFFPRDGRLHLPFGHQVLVANAKNERYAAFTQGGQVGMEELARELVEMIASSSWSTTSDAGETVATETAATTEGQ